VDGSGNSYVTGYFDGSATFGAGEANQTVLTADGNFDIFVAKYNSSGALHWAKRAGGADFDEAYGIAVDGSGNSYVTGYFEGSATFGAGEANQTILTVVGSNDAFVAKYNSSGALQWAKRAGGTGFVDGIGIRADSSGNSYVAGTFSGSATFGAGESNQTTLAFDGGFDIFVAKYNSSGALQWAKRAGGTSSDEGYGIGVDGSGNSYVTGYFDGSSTFGAGESNQTTLTAAGGGFDIFVAKYNASGALQWAKRAGGTDLELGYGIGVDGSGNSYVTGYFDGSATFGAGEANQITLTSAGSYDIFIAKFSGKKTEADFDGDGKSDITVFRGGAWLMHDFTSGTQNGAVWTGTSAGCVPVAMDYDGDGKMDFTQFCNGAWHFYNNNGIYNKGIWTGGVAGDLPVPADYDGDGKDDVVVYRGGAWLFYNFTTGVFDAAKSIWTGGGGSCIPVPMDYNGDGKADFTQLCSGAWHFHNNNGSYNKGIWTGGAAGDLPVPADYDGDGIDDVVVFRGGAWLFYNFATGAYDAAKSVWTGAPPHWTGGITLPAPIDYDGNGKVDFTVYSGGPWYFFNGNGTFNKGIWTGGVAGDQAISKRLLP
jgi:hypothetical protein